LQDMERVRNYQVKRLNYYYAVAEFNTINAADCVYKECDKMEYELSATTFDLRFIPDGMEFNDDPPKEVCDKAPDVDNYKPKLFSTTALSLGKVDLTWDETDPQRLAAMKKAFDMDDGNDDLVKQFIAGSSDDELDDQNDDKVGNDIGYDPGEFSEEDDEKVIAKYRALLQGAEEKIVKDDDEDANEDSDNSEEGDMEMTFVPEADKNKVDEEKVLESMTPWEKYLHKKKEKRKQKKSKKENDEAVEGTEEQDGDLPSDVDLDDPFFKEELSKLSTSGKDAKTGKGKKKSKHHEQKVDNPKDLELLTMDSDDDKKHFDYKDIVEQETKSKKRRMKKKKSMNKNTPEDDFKMDLSDERFSGIFNNPKYNVDPSHPSFKKTKSMASIIDEKQKRILKGDLQHTNEGEIQPKSDKKQSSALITLANSIKSKSNGRKRKRSDK